MEEKQPQQDKPLKAPEPKKDAFRLSVENFYDKIPLTVKQLDLIIIGGLILIVILLVVGALKGNGIL